MMRLSIALATAMLGVALAGAAPRIAQAEEAIVIESDVVGVEQGAMIPDGGTLVVPDGKSVTLITNSGQTIALKGPFSGRPATGSGGGESQVVAVLSGLFERSEEKGALGVTRSINFPLAANTYELGNSGQVCLFDVNEAKIAAPTNAVGGARVTLMSVTGNASATVDVPTRGTVAWPTELALKNGAKFLVQKAGENSGKMITIRVVDSRAQNDLDRVLEMAGAGCDQQALRLLNTIKNNG